MISLTTLLKRIPDKLSLSKYLPPLKFPVLSHPLLNPYPDWINQFKAWGIFGTFSDYVIRKILLNLFSNKVKNLKTIAEEGYYTLVATIEAEDNSFLDTVVPDIPKEDLLRYVEEMEQALDNFYVQRLHWKPELYEIYRMSCLDKIVRKNELVMPQFSKRQIQECIPFFEHLEKWLEYKFKDSNNFFLNPILGHTSTIAADADLLIDSALYEIKTVKYPTWYIENEYHQLFGYVSLFENQKENNLSSFREWEDLDTIGYIFPLHLQLITMDISSWKKKERSEFLSKLLDYAVIYD